LVAKIDFGRIDFSRIDFAMIGFGTIAWIDSFGFSTIDLGRLQALVTLALLAFAQSELEHPFEGLCG